jgi:hypothetical protein
MLNDPIPAALKKDVDRALAALNEALPIIDKCDACGMPVDEHRLRNADLRERLSKFRDHFGSATNRKGDV